MLALSCSLGVLLALYLRFLLFRPLGVGRFTQIVKLEGIIVDEGFVECGMAVMIVIVIMVEGTKGKWLDNVVASKLVVVECWDIGNPSNEMTA